MTLLHRFLSVRLGVCLLFALLASVDHAAVAASYAVDAARSQLSASFKMEGVVVEGQFRKFASSAEFDPANLAQTSAQLDIDTAGFDLGNPDYNSELGNKDWFNTAQYPKATFVSKTVKVAGPGKLDIAGRLTIKGKSADVIFPVSYRQDGKGYVFDGAVPIKRLAFDIGEGEWRDTSVLENEVNIKFRIYLVPHK
jgi:polyisoprenoid-binding protein YceI